MQISGAMTSPLLQRRVGSALPVAAMQNKAENLVQTSGGVPASAANSVGSRKSNPLLANISRLQSRIEEVKGNDEMSPEAKETLLKTMTQQLADLQKQMAEAMQADKKREEDKDASGNARDRFGTASVQDKESDKKSREDARIADLLAAGSSLHQSKEMGAVAAKAQSAAQRMERELDYATNHPIEALRLTNPETIQNRQKEISSLQLGIKQIQAAQAYGAQAVKAPAADALAPAAAEDADANAAPATKGVEGDREMTISSDKNVDEEIQKLKATKQQIQMQFAEAATPDDKVAIQQQLRQLDAQIRSKDSAAYRQSHAHYWQA